MSHAGLRRIEQSIEVTLAASLFNSSNSCPGQVGKKASTPIENKSHAGLRRIEWQSIGYALGAGKPVASPACQSTKE